MSSKKSILWLSLMLCCFSCYGLSPPCDLHWAISGAYVHLTWKHSHTDEPLNGYYVSVQHERNARKELSAPDFVHLDKSVRSTDLQGLLPDAVYQIKVVAYSGEVHKSSAPIIVRTKGLELLLARNLTISGISTRSAMFQWEHDAKHTIHDTQFKLFCRGVRQYLDENNKLVEESDDFEYAPFASSQGRESYFPSNLQPNTKYTCHITTVAETVESPPTPDVSFKTAYGVPSPPPKPKIAVHHNSSFTVSLYHSIERFGPISHYKIFAVPVKKETDLPINSHFVPIVPPSKLLTHVVSPQLLTHESDPAPFIVGTYKFKQLPRSISFNGNEMRLSFKPNTHYTFVTAVFTQSKAEETEGLHSFSAPANPPVFISKDLQEDWIQQHQPVAKHFTIIVTCTLVSVTLLFIAAFLSAFASNYYQGKKRDAYFFTVADDDSSEDEIYSKPNVHSSFRPSSSKSANRGADAQQEVVPLLTQSPQTSTTPVVQLKDLLKNENSPAFEEETYYDQSQTTTQEPDSMADALPSNSPAKIPTSSIRNSPAANTDTDYQGMYESPPPASKGPPSIDQTPVTMHHIRDYLANKSGRTASSPLPSEQEIVTQSQGQSTYDSYDESELPTGKNGQPTPRQAPSLETLWTDNPGRNIGPLKRPSLKSYPRGDLNFEMLAGIKHLPPPGNTHTDRHREYATLQLQDIPPGNEDYYSSS